MVPTFEVLRPSALLEEEVLDVSEQALEVAISSTGKLGLTGAPSSVEMFHKYGSTTAARLAVKFDRRRGV